MTLPPALAVLAVAAIPFIYYLIVLYSSWRFFQQPRAGAQAAFTPPVSILKPIRGVDPDAYENFSSFCRQDYPEYEILFCVSDRDDPVLPVIERLRREFPERRIEVFFGSGRNAANDKVAKLARMVEEARYEYVVINDSDVRARPDYLRRWLSRCRISASALPPASTHQLAKKHSPMACRP
jgi:ceramide glucosyltransferase